MNIQERTGRSDRTDLKTQDDLKGAVNYTDAFAAKKKKNEYEIAAEQISRRAQKTDW